MHRPPEDPIGLQLIGAARAIRDALDDVLTREGGSLSTWRVLVSQKDQHPGSHPDPSESAIAVHEIWSEEVDRLEAGGLVIRGADPTDPRVPTLELTEAGEALFRRLLRAVVAFDARMRVGLTDEETASFTNTLSRLKGNVGDGPRP